MKTTKKQFELFKKEARKWIQKLGVVEYDVHFEHEDLEDNCAECGTNEQARLCYLYLGTEWQKIKPTSREIKTTACHEVLELLFSRVRALAVDKNGTPEQVDGEIHRLIQTLLNNLYESEK
jgi:hypothetical protein